MLHFLFLCGRQLENLIGGFRQTKITADDERILEGARHKQSLGATYDQPDVFFLLFTF